MSYGYHKHLIIYPRAGLSEGTWWQWSLGRAGQGRQGRKGGLHPIFLPRSNSPISSHHSIPSKRDFSYAETRISDYYGLEKQKQH